MCGKFLCFCALGLALFNSSSFAGDPDPSKIHVSVRGKWLPITTTFEHAQCIVSVTNVSGAAEFVYQALRVYGEAKKAYDSSLALFRDWERLNELVHMRLVFVGRTRQQTTVYREFERDALDWEYEFLENLLEKYEQLQSAVIQTMTQLGEYGAHWERVNLELGLSSKLKPLLDLVLELQQSLEEYQRISEGYRHAIGSKKPQLYAGLPEILVAAIERKKKQTEQRKTREPIWVLTTQLEHHRKELGEWQRFSLSATNGDLDASIAEIRTHEEAIEKIYEELRRAILPAAIGKDQRVAIEVRAKRQSRQGGRSASGNVVFQKALLGMYKQLAKKKGWEFSKIGDSILVFEGKGSFEYLKGETGKQTFNGKLGGDRQNFNHTAFVAVAKISATAEVDAIRVQVRGARDDERPQRAYLTSTSESLIRNHGIHPELIPQALRAEEVLVSGSQTELFFDLLLLQRTIEELTESE